MVGLYDVTSLILGNRREICIPKSRMNEGAEKRGGIWRRAILRGKDDWSHSDKKSRAEIWHIVVRGIVN